jgi:hypothetical protein
MGSKMTEATWNAIHERHMWFARLLQARVASECAISEAESTNDPAALRALMYGESPGHLRRDKLAKRAQRHAARIQRHLDKALAAWESAAATQ